MFPNQPLKAATKRRALKRNRIEKSDQHETLAKVWKLTNVVEFARNSTRPGPPRNESFGPVEVESVWRTKIALEFKVLEREREE